MSVVPRFLPQGVDPGSSRFLQHLRKSRRSDLQQFHGTRQKKKSARELRQRGSNYRCCIPALAGFVSPQSIAPDGNKKSRKNAIAQWPIRGLPPIVDRMARFCLHRRVKWLVLSALMAMQCSCTTLVNRRDLYQPNQGPVPTRTKTTTTTTTEQADPALPSPQFR